MLQYLLTGAAGIIVGIVAMRIWSARLAVAAGSQPETKPAAMPAASALSTRNLLIMAAVLTVAATGVLLLAPSDDATTPPSVATTGAVPGQAAAAIGDVDTMIARLAARLEKNPDDGEGFRMLGWSYVMTGRPGKAIAPYKRALTLLPESAVVHSGYGEALVGIAGNTVTPEARAAFEKALSLDPAEPRARYFLALHQAQAGEEREALDKLVALAKSGPADAPWQADVHRQIAAISGRLSIDVPTGLKTPVPAAAASVSASDIGNMVEGLATRLKANPADAQGWAMLLRSRMVQQMPDKAAADLAAARKALAGDRAGLAMVNAAASQLGVPGA